MARVVVIGAGMGGLAVAARLAAKGHRVTVCEGSRTHGGAVGAVQRDGFSFDLGPTLLYLPAVYRDLFIKTRRRSWGTGEGTGPLEECVDLRAVDPASCHVLADGATLTVPNATRAGVIHELDATYGPGAGQSWSALMTRARVAWNTVRRPLLEEPLSRRGLLTDPYLPRRRPWSWRGEPSLADVARRELRPFGLATLLEGYAFRHGLNPEATPACAVTLAYLEHSFGAWYVTGGMRALADAVLQRCERQGVKLRFGARVVALRREGERVCGVELADATAISADVVVSAIDTQALARLPGAPAATDGFTGSRQAVTRTVARGTIPGRFTVLLALSGARPQGTAHHTVVHAQDHAAELTAVFTDAAPCERPTVEVVRPDDDSSRPHGGCEAVTLRVTVAPHGPEGIDWTAEGLAVRYADQVMATAERAVPGLRERLLWHEVRTPADTERDTGVPGGGVRTPALAGRGGAFLNADNRTSVTGLYRVGGSTHPGGGLPHTGMSAAITAELIGQAVGSD